MRLYCDQHKRYLAVRKPRVKGYLTCHCWVVYYLAKLLRALGLGSLVGYTKSREVSCAQGSGREIDAGVQSPGSQAPR